MSFAARLRVTTTSLLAVPALSTCWRRLVLQRRALHLVKTAKAVTVLGNHGIIPWSPYQVPDMMTARQRITLLDRIGGRVVAKDLTFAQVYNDYLKPGHMLHATQKMPSILPGLEAKAIEQKLPDTCNTYAIVKAGDCHVHIKPIPTIKYTNEDKTQVVGVGPLREINLLGTTDPEYWRRQLDKTYRMLQAGYVLEFHVKIKHNKLDKKRVLTPGPSSYWPTLHNHFPHLRPDFLFKSMPPGTRWYLPPWTDGRTLMWAWALETEHEGRDLATRLLEVKKSVVAAAQQGRLRSLPMKIRSAIEAGDEAVAQGLLGPVKPGYKHFGPEVDRLLRHSGEPVFKRLPAAAVREVEGLVGDRPSTSALDFLAPREDAGEATIWRKKDKGRAAPCTSWMKPGRAAPHMSWMRRGKQGKGKRP